MRTIREERQARDLDLFVNMVNNDPQHIARAKAKRDRVLAEERRKAEQVQPGNALLGTITAFSVWALALVALV